MNTRIAAVSALSLLALVGMAAVHSQPARSQVNVAPLLVPIGVSSSGNLSTAWFHEPSNGQAVVCQTVSSPGAGLTGVQCVRTRLP